jgi:3-oxoadipate enol-lactonase
LKGLKIAAAHFCGLSMGGMIGQTFALKYPGVFKTLMLADTTSRYPAEAASAWADRIKIASERGMEPLAQPTLERWFTESFRKTSAAAVDGVRKLIVDTPVAGYVGCCHAIPKINLTARLKEIKCPILVIVGEQDPGTPPAMAKEIHDAAPGSRLVVIPQAAHLSNLEQPAAFTRTMEQFLAGK